MASVIRRARSSRATQEFAVIGLGRFGISVARTLVERGHTVLGLDRDPAIVQRFADQVTQALSLDSSDEEALREVDIASYGTVIVAIGQNFEANLMTTVALKSLGVQSVICKATTMVHRDILLRVGADRVVLPEHDGGRRIAEELSMPEILHEIPLPGDKRLTELLIPSTMVGHPVSGAVEGYEISVVALVRGEKVLVHPPRYEVLQESDVLIVIGTAEDIERLSTR